MALVNTDDGLLTQGFFKNKFWGKLLGMLSNKLNVTDNGSNLSVTPDGTSTGYDLGSSTTLKTFAQKFKNLVGALKALAFKDKVTDSDISGTISDSHIASASTWNGKQNDLGINASSGSATKFLNEQGNFVNVAATSPDIKEIDRLHFGNSSTYVGIQFTQFAIRQGDCSINGGAEYPVPQTPYVTDFN